MTLHITISSEAEARLRERAAASGQAPETVAARIVEDAVEAPSLDEVLGPVRAEFEVSGVSEDELGDMLEKAKHEMRAARRARRDP